MKQNKNAIALLITVLFVIVITVAIGFGLRQVNSATDLLKNEKFIYQSNIIIDDVLNILKTSPDVALVADSNGTEELFMLLSQTSFIPIVSADLELVLKIHSARDRFNPAALDAQKADFLRVYMDKKNVNSQYVDVLLDNIGGVKVDNSYNSAIFEENPFLFRDYIASKKHLQQINDFYLHEFADNSLKNIPFEKLFYFSADANQSIDLNYATAQTWEFIAGVTKEKAESLQENAGAYEDFESLSLSSDEFQTLQNFKTSFFEPILLVEIELRQNKTKAYIRFEYDIKKKRGTNFVYFI